MKDQVMTFEELDKYIEETLTQYKPQVETDSVEELQASEKDLMVEMDDYNAYLQDRVYVLPETIEFDGVEYSKVDVVEKLVEIIADRDIEWKFTKGTYELIRDWKNAKEVSYSMFDTTLRMVSQCKFNGVDKCVDAAIVNELLSPSNTGYFKDSADLIILHNKHQMILNRVEEITQLNTPVESSDYACGEEDCQCGK